MRARAAFLTLCLAAAPAAADRLHLESGGVIDTKRWRIEGENVLYDSAGGTIGIPRSMVLRIERSAGTPLPPPPVATAVTESRSNERDAERRDQTRQQIEAGSAALENGDCETASNHFFNALGHEPRAYAARVQYALCEIRLGHDQSARSAVLDGLVLHPEGAELHELLGDLEDRDENLQGALLAWRRAETLKPGERLTKKIDKGQRDLDTRRGYEFARTSHFNLRYDGTIDEALASEVSQHLEEQFWELTNIYGHTPRQPITTLLYPNEAFREVTRSAEWVGGVYDGKIRVPLGGLKHLHRGARRVLTHELTHAVIHAKSRQRCPRWLQEGLAQVSDGTRLTSSDVLAVQAKLSESEDTWKWESGDASYPLALSFTRWLEDRRDFSHLVWLLELLGEGHDVDDALQRVYGDDYEGLANRWEARMLAGTGE
jgi:hypothetical protein